MRQKNHLEKRAQEEKKNENTKFVTRRERTEKKREERKKKHTRFIYFNKYKQNIFINYTHGEKERRTAQKEKKL